MFCPSHVHVHPCLPVPAPYSSLLCPFAVPMHTVLMQFCAVQGCTMPCHALYINRHPYCPYICDVPTPFRFSSHTTVWMLCMTEVAAHLPSDPDYAPPCFAAICRWWHSGLLCFSTCASVGPATLYPPCCVWWCWACLPSLQCCAIGVCLAIYAALPSPHPYPAGPAYLKGHLWTLTNHSCPYREIFMGTYVHCLSHTCLHHVSLNVTTGKMRKPAAGGAASP